MGLLKIIKKDIEEAYPEDIEFFDVQDWIWDFIARHNIALPLTKADLDDDEPEDEVLDLENFALLQLEDNLMKFCGGGDWQQPLEIDMSLNDLGEIEMKIVKQNEYREREDCDENDYVLKQIGVIK